MPSFAEMNSWRKLKRKKRNARVNLKAVFLSGFSTAALTAADTSGAASEIFAAAGTSFRVGDADFSQFFGEDLGGLTGSATAVPALGLGLNLDTSGPASVSIAGYDVF